METNDFGVVFHEDPYENDRIINSLKEKEKIITDALNILRELHPNIAKQLTKKVKIVGLPKRFAKLEKLRRLYATNKGAFSDVMEELNKSSPPSDFLGYSTSRFFIDYFDLEKLVPVEGSYGG